MKNLAEKINTDKKFYMEAYSFIKSELDKETARPLRKRDFDRIEQLTGQLAELSEDKPSYNTDKLFKRIDEYERAAKKPVNVFKRFMPVLCCFVLIFTANCVTVAAWDMNIISAVIEFTKGGFSVDFGKQPEEVILPTSEDDPYGIIGKCEEIGIHVETPHYIPDGFVLTQIGTDNDNPQRKCIGFVYKKENQLINITFDDFMNGKVGIPSDHYNISERKICGHTTIVSKEDNQMIAVFHSGDFDVIISTINVDYSECDKILDSIK